MEFDPNDLSVRGRNCFKLLGVQTLDELARKSTREVLAVRGSGHTTLCELRTALASAGLRFNDEAESRPSVAATRVHVILGETSAELEQSTNAWLAKKEEEASRGAAFRFIDVRLAVLAAGQIKQLYHTIIYQE
jgi:hypothetical protein